jgi:hypothetical protein
MQEPDTSELLERLRISFDGASASSLGSGEAAAAGGRRTLDALKGKLADLIPQLKQPGVLEQVATLREKMPLLYKRKMEMTLNEIKQNLIRARNQPSNEPLILEQSSDCLALTDMLASSSLFQLSSNYGELIKELDSAATFGRAKLSYIEASTSPTALRDILRATIHNIFDTLMRVVSRILEDITRDLLGTVKAPPDGLIPYERLILQKDQGLLDQENLEVGVVPCVLCPVPFAPCSSSFPAQAHTTQQQPPCQKYLSDEDCILHLGYAKEQLSALPIWKLKYVKRRAGLI